MSNDNQNADEPLSPPAGDLPRGFPPQGRESGRSAHDTAAAQGEALLAPSPPAGDLPRGFPPQGRESGRSAHDMAAAQGEALLAPSPPAGDLPRGFPPQGRESGRSGVLPERAWYGEPMVWLVIGIPLATVIAGVSTVATAFGVGNVDSVIDPVKRTGKMQEFKMSGDRAAARLGLTADGHVDADTQALRLRLAGDLPATAQLKLTFAHPVRTSQDRSTLVIAHGDAEFLGRADIELDHDWNLILAPEDGSWRLVGRFIAHASAFELRPALPGG